MHVENPKGSKTKLLELKNKFNKALDCNVNIQNHLYFSILGAIRELKLRITRLSKLLRNKLNKR